MISKNETQPSRPRQVLCNGENRMSSYLLHFHNLLVYPDIFIRESLPTREIQTKALFMQG